MERVLFITHRGKQILHINMAGCKAAETLDVIKQARSIIGKQQPQSVLTFTDSTDAHFDNEVNETLKEYVQHNKPFVRASAVLGVTGLRQIIFNAAMRISGRHMVAFDDRQKALDWLADH